MKRKSLALGLVFMLGLSQTVNAGFVGTVKQKLQKSTTDTQKIVVGSADVAATLLALAFSHYLAGQAIGSLTALHNDWDPSADKKNKQRSEDDLERLKDTRNKFVFPMLVAAVAFTFDTARNG